MITTVLSFTGRAESCDTNIEINDQYTVQSDGTVTDKVSGLMWMRCRLGESWDGNQCIGEAIAYDWSDALLMSQTSTFAEHNDWHVPNIKQLFSMVALNCSFPAIDETLFPNTGYAAFWSSSHNSANAGEAWTIDFYKGEPVLYAKNRSNYVRLVRKTAP